MTSSLRPLVFAALLVAAACGAPAASAPGPVAAVPAANASARDMGSFRVYRGDGRPANVAAIVDLMQASSVVFIGEEHDDTVGHRVEALLLSQAIARWRSRPVVLSLEMFERDVQGVVDEYVGGLIDEPNFVAASRPWPAYKSAYRPMIEQAKANGLRVVAANAPRRYVSLASREGIDALGRVSAESRRSLPPLPLPPASAAYRARFDSVAGGPDHDGMPAHAFDGQWLWDASMADAIAGVLTDAPEALVLHVTGGFHVERRMGTVEALGHARPGTAALVVTIRKTADPADFDPAEDAGLADFVILTRR